MIVGSEADIEGLKKAGRAVAAAREAMLLAVRPGITTLELDRVGERVLAEHGAVSAPRKEYDFPGATCISVNRCAAHGIPNARPLQEGDIVNVDVSAALNGYYSDTGATMVVGTSPGAHRNANVMASAHMEKLKLLAASEKALYAALSKAKAGAKISELGKAVMKVARDSGYSVIRNLTGHGIGLKLHEEPEHIFSYPEPRDRRLLKRGMVLAIEPFLATGGAQYVEEGDDGWALLLPDGGFVSQFEHTVIVTESEPIILTKL
ncbi:type I methionyl aminopeptidase [Paenibacillus alkalitolerans]|uniref:type I methionyl aminopeptidase n=1 Tax=Paenibacillus alkalitolerans TaxID=2799335 RepID=UPI0018F475CC|nr:type I methionyl aminopeptidase [Paenibacillus alkalitolerans]